jgi:uncharacterized damage-inducible protein DinB
MHICENSTLAVAHGLPGPAASRRVFSYIWHLGRTRLLDRWYPPAAARYGATQPWPSLSWWRVSKSLLTDAFDHHVWASMRILDACLVLSPEQLAATATGTYGSILDTARHLVGADRWYLFRIGGERIPLIDEDQMDLAELRAAMERNGAEWPRLLEDGLDPDALIVTRRDDGSETHAPVGIRIAQVLHHGTDHRSQICTVLTTLGVEPPDIDVWDFGAETGRTIEVPPTSDG